jgi:hypothetical protein
MFFELEIPIASISGSRTAGGHADGAIHPLYSPLLTASHFAFILSPIALVGMAVATLRGCWEIGLAICEK